MPNFYAGQTDYIDQLNALATSNELVDISSGLSTVNASVTAAAASASAAAASQTAAANSASSAATQATNATAAKNAALASQTAAASSASAAATSQTAASTSASAAATSQTAAANSASTASTQATNAANSATTAGNHATTAGTHATNAGNSATTAGTHATNAAASATAASNSASTASTQATNAANSASTASTQATNAANSATTAGTHATNAGNSATTAGTHATNAAASATAAANSASTASTQATNAANSATTAANSATTAGTHATNAGNSATTAGTHATNAAASATAAANSASTASTQATNAANSASTASTQATNATNSATTAGTHATNAGNSATTAGTHATNAAASATAASNSASTASTQATNASNSATTAGNHATTAGTHATNAANSATSAAGYLTPATGTSTTSVLIGTGSKSFTIETGKLFAVGHPVKIVRTSDPTNTYMAGVVTSYISGTGALVVSVDIIIGSGTFTDWTVTITTSGISATTLLKVTSVSDATLRAERTGATATNLDVIARSGYGEVLTSVGALRLNPANKTVYMQSTDGGLFYIQSTSSTTNIWPGLVVDSHSANGGFPVSELRMSKGTSVAPLAVGTSTVLGGFNTWGWGGTSAGFKSATRIQGISRDTFALDANVSAGIDFLVTSANVQYQALRIDHNASLVVGKSATTAYVTSNGAADLILNTNEGTNSSAYVQIGNGTGGSVQIIIPSGNTGYFQNRNVNNLGSVANNTVRIKTDAGVGNNNIFNTKWLKRQSAGSDWTTTRWHDAIHIDSSFGTPGTNTKCWYERDAQNALHVWGNDAYTGMTLAGSGTLMNLSVNGSISSATGATIANGITVTALATPGQPTGTPSTTGGSMAATTTYARIVAIDMNGLGTLGSTESAGVVTTGSTASIAWTWTTVAGATSYRIYVGATGAQTNYYTSTTNSYTQTTPSASGTAASVPASNPTGSLVVPGRISTNEYVHAAYLNMSHGATTNTTDTIFYSSYDSYIRKNTALGFKESLGFADLRAGFTMHGGGTITVDTSGYVLWSSRFISISNGTGSKFSTNGFFDITCPTSGTITGVGSAANVTATAAGIPLVAWQALYYILPIGSGSPSVAANFRVVSHTAALDIPPHWIQIAGRNGDNGTFYFPNGIKLALNSSFNTTITDGTYPYTTASIVLNNTSWTDTGIAGTTFSSGSYNIRIQTGTNEFYYGVLPWFSGNGAATLNDEFTEIPLMKAGDGGTATSIFCRVFRTASAAPKLQLSASATLATYAYVFQAKRIL